MGFHGINLPRIDKVFLLKTLSVKLKGFMIPVRQYI